MYKQAPWQGEGLRAANYFKVFSSFIIEGVNLVQVVGSRPREESIVAGFDRAPARLGPTLSRRGGPGGGEASRKGERGWPLRRPLQVKEIGGSLVGERSKRASPGARPPPALRPPSLVYRRGCRSAADAGRGADPPRPAGSPLGRGGLALCAETRFGCEDLTRTRSR